MLHMPHFAEVSPSNQHKNAKLSSMFSVMVVITNEACHHPRNLENFLQIPSFANGCCIHYLFSFLWLWLYYVIAKPLSLFILPLSASHTNHGAINSVWKLDLAFAEAAWQHDWTNVHLIYQQNLKTWVVFRKTL